MVRGTPIWRVKGSTRRKPNRQFMRRRPSQEFWPSCWHSSLPIHVMALWSTSCTDRQYLVWNLSFALPPFPPCIIFDQLIKPCTNCATIPFYVRGCFRPLHRCGIDHSDSASLAKKLEASKKAWSPLLVAENASVHQLEPTLASICQLASKIGVISWEIGKIIECFLHSTHH